jgi:energy-coupling factor transport system substrate-specific component
MNLWSWPYTVGAGTGLSFLPGASTLSNLHRFLVFSVTTSALGWDTGRAVTNSVAIVVLGPAVLATLRRAARRASFGAVATYAADSADTAGARDTAAAVARDMREAADAPERPAAAPPARQRP